MKARKVQPVAYAVVEHNYCEYHVYADGRVLKEDFNSNNYDHYSEWEDDYEEIKAAGLEVLK